ncbi:MAG: FAD-dependent oxidoreductase, partial [Bacteroidota bacterium]
MGHPSLSYWEIKTWLSNIDFTIVGSGIVGLSCALQLRRKFPNAKILVLEKGMLPQGASTKNAGFACFGSMSEILDDLKSHSEEEVFDLVRQRWDGLQLLRESLGDKQLDFQKLGGYELFRTNDTGLFESCLANVGDVNDLLRPIFKTDVFSLVPNNFQFNNIKENLIFNQFEGQIDTGRMMEAMLKKANQKNIKILNGLEVQEFSEGKSSVDIRLNEFELKTSKLLVATNGFASKLNISEVKPARAQVLITKPIKNLSIKGTFHLEQGYYYFRNIDNRVLFGGGRHLDKHGETTIEFGQTDLIQNDLEHILRSVILPNREFEIDQRWSGVMGIGEQKKPIV